MYSPYIRESISMKSISSPLIYKTSPNGTSFLVTNIKIPLQTHTHSLEKLTN